MDEILRVIIAADPPPRLDKALARDVPEAAALSRLLGPLLDITLVESDDIGTVGVGEATIPTHRVFHHLLNINEPDFMRATKATFKLGIAFENWGQIGDRYIHSFGQIGRPNWMGEFYHIWMLAREKGFGGELDEYCLELQAAEKEVADCMAQLTEMVPPAARQNPVDDFLPDGDLMNHLHINC